MLTEGWAGYVDDHKGVLPSATRARQETDAPSWYGGAWMDFPSTAITGVDPYFGDNSISKGAIFEYSGSDPSIWRCPSDSSTGSHPNYRDRLAVPRVRSYSMNIWIGNSAWQDGYVLFRRMSDLALAGPEGVFLILDERFDSINDGSFVVEMTGYDPGDITEGAQNKLCKLVDYPGNYHGNAAVMSFVDGHVETHEWVDPRMTPPRVAGELDLNIGSPGNTDVWWLQRRATVPKL